MAEGMQVRAISNGQGNRLLRIVRLDPGSVVTWRQAQMVLLSAQAMDVTRIADVAFTSEGRVRDLIHNFDADASRRFARAIAGVAHRSSRFRSGDRFSRWRSLVRPITACRS